MLREADCLSMRWHHIWIKVNSSLNNIIKPFRYAYQQFGGSNKTEVPLACCSSVMGGCLSCEGGMEAHYDPKVCCNDAQAQSSRKAEAEAGATTVNRTPATIETSNGGSQRLERNESGSELQNVSCGSGCWESGAVILHRPMMRATKSIQAQLIIPLELRIEASEVFKPGLLRALHSMYS